jgi:NADH-quinone oxidoreductase subunit N
MSLGVYAMVGLRRNARGIEAALKYFLLGSFAAALMLFGAALLYGATGHTDLAGIGKAISTIGDAKSTVPTTPVLMALVLMLAGLAFKVSAVPFHMWTPDAYEGAPTPVTTYMAVAVKSAAFAMLLRVLLGAFGDDTLTSWGTGWPPVLALLSVLTMVMANVVAGRQSSVKRMLAYSSIAHAGYAMIGLVALSALGTASLVYYLAAYVFTNLAAFGVVVLFARTAGSDEIADYAGLSRRSPYLALALMVAILSLAGMPPLAGFMAKFLVFYAAVQSGLAWLAIVGVLNAIIGLYYYMIVLKVVYLYRSDDEATPIEVPRASALALGLCSVGIVLMGTLTAPWVSWALNAAGNLF